MSGHELSQIITMRQNATHLCHYEHHIWTVYVLWWSISVKSCFQFRPININITGVYIIVVYLAL